MADMLKMIPLDEITIGRRFREDLGDIELLAESIKEKGVCQPITVTKVVDEVGNYILIAGGRRVAAAKLAGLTKIPALLRDQHAFMDTEIDLREIELLENIQRKDFTWVEQSNLIAELDRLCREKNQNWSARKTAQVLGHSHPMNVSRSLQLSEALETIPELAKCKTQDDALKMLKKLEENIVTNELRRRQEETRDTGLRDILTMAKNNYKIGDAIESLKALPNNAGMVNFIEVDPPYGIDLPEVKSGKNKNVETYKEVPRADYAQFLKDIAEQTFRIANAHCWMVFWFGPTHHHLVITTLRAAGWSVDDIPGIWTKGYGQSLQPEVHLSRTYEPFFICRKGQPTLTKHGRSNVFNFDPIPGVKKIHPTERPVALIEELINTFSGINSRVLVPFLGSGNTLRAVYNTGGTGWGYDLNPEYRDKFLLSVEADTKSLDKEE